MSKYIPFTTEQKERAASVDLEEFLQIGRASCRERV